MYLLLCIILSTIVGYLLFLLGPLLGGIIAFGIIVGCLLRALYLLKDISQSISKTSPKPNKVETAYNNYIKEKDKTC
ncbi:hypothetical protein [Priestia filamentosa]|uniref:hypothetical protein n=1 Tax=Priestia filamentosa TaxID=1402861 RepID=UPI000A08DCB5|nr:hypothetical protein [Priestia filamentosa]MDT3763558.1 hypothetical protein [Priestia filamentosa]OXS71945.1 hypothetical protein B1B01_06390 [Priestia filamentosa]SMF16225.1 hypothetical protein SAMN06296056_1011306 [Priestia filamentosa]